MKPTRATYLVLVVAMIAMAILDNVRGVFVPSFKVVFSLNNTGIGWLFLFSSLCYMISSFASGYIIKATHQKTVLMGGASIVTVGILTVALAPNVVLFFGAMLVINVGVAAMGLAINTAIPLMQVKNKAVLMNAVHFLYGVGATVTQKSTGMLLSINWTFKTIYIGIAILFALLILITWKAAIPEEPAHRKVKTHFNKGQKQVLVLFSIALGLYVVGELQTGNWFINYLKTSYGVNESIAANFTTIFFLVFSLGRLFGGFAVAKIGYLRSVYISITIASVLYLIGLTMGYAGAWLIAISGVFFSIAYPTTMLAVTKFYKGSITQASGIIITFSAGVNMLVSLLVGVVADRFNIGVAMYIMPICLIVSAALFVYIAVKGPSLVKDSEPTAVPV